MVDLARQNEKLRAALSELENADRTRTQMGYDLAAVKGELAAARRQLAEASIGGGGGGGGGGRPGSSSDGGGFELRKQLKEFTHNVQARGPSLGFALLPSLTFYIVCGSVCLYRLAVICVGSRCALPFLLFPVPFSLASDEQKRSSSRVSSAGLPQSDFPRHPPPHVHPPPPPPPPLHARPLSCLQMELEAKIMSLSSRCAAAEEQARERVGGRPSSRPPPASSFRAPPPSCPLALRRSGEDRRCAFCCYSALTLSPPHTLSPFLPPPLPAAGPEPGVHVQGHAGVPEGNNATAGRGGAPRARRPQAAGVRGGGAGRPVVILMPVTGNPPVGIDVVHERVQHRRPCLFFRNAVYRPYKN